MTGLTDPMDGPRKLSGPFYFGCTPYTHRSPFMRPKFLAALALCVSAAAPLAAQTTVTPFIGSMIPMRSLLADTGGAGGFRMQAHTIIGFRLARPMSSKLGLELAVGAGSGEMQAITSGDYPQIKTAVWFADLQARVRLAGNDDANVGAIVGAGWTQFSSGLFDAAHEADENTSFAGRVTGIVGLGFHGKLGEHVLVSFDATDRIHEQGIDAPGLDTDQYTKYLQHDATFTFGLAIPLGS